jgi:hypothetical protein
MLMLMFLTFVSGGCGDSQAPLPPAVSTGPAPAVPTPAAVPPMDAAGVAARPHDGPEQPQADGKLDQESAKPRPILGKTTSDIRDAQKEEAKGAQRVKPRVTGKDPISISGSAYVSIIGRTEILKIKHTLDLYQAETGRYPKDLDEFMREIIKKGGIRLAQLPNYQEYGYDSEKHELIILEYPDRKGQ